MAEEKKTMSDRKKGLKDEFSKIIWPSSEMVGKQSAVVIIISGRGDKSTELYDIVDKFAKNCNN